MSEYDSFSIDFYVTYTNEAPMCTVSSSGTVPSSTTISNTINEIIEYINDQGLSIGNFNLIITAITNLTARLNAEGYNSTEITTQIDNVKTKLSSTASSLSAALKELQTTIQATVQSEDITLPDDDVDSTQQAVVLNRVRSRHSHGSSRVINFKGVSSKVTDLQGQFNTSRTSYADFVGKTQNAMKAVVNGDTTVNITPTTTNTTMVTNKTTTNTNNNLINNIARRLLGNFNPPTLGSRNSQRIKRGSGNNSTINTLSAYKAPAATSTTVTGTAQATDYYSITSRFTSGYVNVSFAYFQANSTESSFACNFTLTPKSLTSLSFAAYMQVIKATVNVKSMLCTNVGYVNSTNPSNQDMWNCYLIWLYSYLSFGVASQLGFTMIEPFPASTYNSANYMLNYEYMQDVGNFAIPIQASTMSSDQAGLLSVTVPGLWATLMYSFESNKRYASTTHYMATSVIGAMSNN